MTKQEVSNDEIMAALSQFINKQEATNDEIMSSLSQFADNVDRRFDRLESDISELKTDVVGLKDDVNRIYGILDAHMARIERILEENSVQSHQQARLERWIFQLADKTNVKLRYDA